MPEKIIFQQDRLTVYDSKLSIGDATVFYPSVSASRIYEGRPLLAASIAGLVGFIPMTLLFFMGARLFGPYFPTKTIVFMMLPMIGLISLGLLYQVKCLFLGIDGSSVAVLKSKDRYILETAQQAIDTAKAEYHKRNEK